MREKIFKSIPKWVDETKGPLQSHAYPVPKNRSVDNGQPSEMDQKGAQFRDPLSGMCWEILTLQDGMCTARERRTGLFAYWLLDELLDPRTQPVRTMWEHLDDDTV